MEDKKMLFCPIVFGVRKNIKPEKFFFHSEYLSIKVKTQVVHTLIQVFFL